MREITVQDLRDMVEEALSKTIAIHRDSRISQDENYTPPTGLPTDEEIDDFIFHNPLLDEETVEQLIDPGLLGFQARDARASEEWLKEFKDNLESWASNNSWLGADEPFRRFLYLREPQETELWKPLTNIAAPRWVESSPTYILLAIDLLHQGKLLSELGWRDFEKLIGDLLESEGWHVQVTKATRDGGLDVVAMRSDPSIGEVKAVWQAKKYSPSNKVKLSEVRELSAIRDNERATKAMIVTTSHLTRDAIEWVKRDVYRLGYKEREDVEKWLHQYEFRLR
jgi:restriction system protein